MGQIKVQIITARRALVVDQSLLRGGADLVYVDVCTMCGSIVFDVILHDEWHFGKSPKSRTTNSEGRPAVHSVEDEGKTGDAE